MQADLGKLILRLAAGGLMIPHGYGKMQRLIEAGGEASFADPIGIGPLPSLVLVIIAELLCPVLIIIGFKTRWSSIPPAIAMAVAALIVHAPDPLGDKELPLLYLAAYLCLALVGGGRYAVDALRR